MFKVEPNSVCSSCNQKVPDSQTLKCAECDRIYHAVCSSAPARESQICNSTFLSAFLKPSTSPNFTWSCDACKTEVETEKVASMRQLMNKMAANHTAQISALTSLVENLASKVDLISETRNQNNAPNNTVWNDEARVQKIKSSLVVKPDEQGNKVSSKVVRKIAAEEGIPIDSLIEATNGEMFVNLPDSESRDRVSQKIQQSHNGNPIVNLTSKLPTISIMGVTAMDMRDDNDEDLGHNELKQSIKTQNKQISDLIDNGSKLEVVYTKPPPHGMRFYTVVARVSPDIRTVIGKMKNKLYVGVSSHHVVDRFHIKRCNRCQKLGHYADKCDLSIPEVCGFCAKNHRSDSCPDKNKDHKFHKCINCSGEGLEASGHPAFWTKCPAYKAAQDKMKKGIAYDYENLN